MLVLSRGVGERLLIGDDIVLTVVRISPDTVRLGIEAPRDVPIVREEIQRYDEFRPSQKNIQPHEETD